MALVVLYWLKINLGNHLNILSIMLLLKITDKSRDTHRYQLCNCVFIQLRIQILL